MHKYLYNYEDFLLIDDDYVVRASSRIADGPKSKPHRGYPGNGEDDDYESYDDYDDYDEREEDYDYGYEEDRDDRR
jgi:hypothetical protein